MTCTELAPTMAAQADCPGWGTCCAVFSVGSEAYRFLAPPAVAAGTTRGEPGRGNAR